MKTHFLKTCLITWHVVKVRKINPKYQEGYSTYDPNIILGKEEYNTIIGTVHKDNQEINRIYYGVGVRKDDRVG